MAGPQTPFE